VTEIDLPLDFPLYLLAAPGGTDCLTAELTHGSIGLFAFTGRDAAERFARDSAIGAVVPIALGSAADAAAAFSAAAGSGATHVAMDAVAGQGIATFPIRDYAERLAKL